MPPFRRWAAAAFILLSSLVRANEPVMLDDAVGAVELWPAAKILRETGARLDIGAAVAHRAEFEVPRSAYATLGFATTPVWLNVPLTVSEASGGAWVFDCEYPLLKRIEVYLVERRSGQVRQQVQLGNHLPVAERPIAARTHAALLSLDKGGLYDLYIRVETPGAKIMPIRLLTPSAFHQRGIDEHLLQGLLISVALCLLVFSLMKWYGLREHLYGKYALVVFFSTVFSLHFFGVGHLYLWVNNEWMDRHLAGMTSLATAGATALFVEEVLGGDLSENLRRALLVVAGILFAAALAYVLDVIDIRIVGVFMSTVGLTPLLLGLPGAIRRERRGDSTGAYFIVAWVSYFIASAVLVGVVTGRIGVNFWTLHSMQFGSTFDALIFMRIAVLRSDALHRAAQHATRERESLISMAQSDPLTGLLNRRGLNDAFTRELGLASVSRPVAIYVLDLDRFKPVNDEHGHDIGDQLLIAVASRLRSSVRAGDAVARLGGDEFVVTASGLTGEGQATDLGHKLLACFETPFSVAEREFSIGATIGYALAPVDGVDAAALLKLADTGLYAGKAAGRNCLRRGTAAEPTTA